MSSSVRVLYNDFKDTIDKYEDKFTANLFLVNAPATNVVILGLWFFFVLKFGPWCMKHRKPFNIDKLLIIYNAFQTVACVGIIIFTTKYIFQLNPFCRSGPHINIDYEIYIAGYCYYILKIIDLLDTVFFVLRKKYSQISFLHLFHHSVMVVSSWLGIKFATHEHMTFLPYINTIVHAVMYFYYMLSIYGKNYKKNLWWKKYITQLQLAQFTILFFLYLPVLFKQDCAFPKMFAFFITVQNCIMMMLFLNFYYQNYIKGSPAVDINNNRNGGDIKDKVK